MKISPGLLEYFAHETDFMLGPNKAYVLFRVLNTGRIYFIHAHFVTIHILSLLVSKQIYQSEKYKETQSATPHSVPVQQPCHQQYRYHISDVVQS